MINCVNNFLNDNLQNFIQNIDTDHCGSTSIFDPVVYNQITEINVQYNKWMAHMNTFHENADQKKKANRVYSFGGYFKAIAALMTELKNPSTSTTTMSPSLNLNNLELFGTLMSTRLSAFFGDSQPEENQTPFTTKLNECLQEWSRLEGITVNIEGKENLELIHLHDNQHNVVNLFLPSHRSPIPDAMVLGHLNLPHYILFANVSSFLSSHKFLSEQIASLVEIIGVGRVRGNENMTAHEKLIKSLKWKISPNVINYPQGFVPSIGEILPISSAFVEKLLTSLIYNGFYVKIIPVSYEVESEFLFDKKNHVGMTYTAKFGKTIEPNAVECLVKLQLGSIINQKHDLRFALRQLDNKGSSVMNNLLCGEIHGNGFKFFDHYLLTHWFENITKHTELSLETLIGRVEKRFGFNLQPYLKSIINNQLPELSKPSDRFDQKDMKYMYSNHFDDDNYDDYDDYNQDDDCEISL